MFCWRKVNLVKNLLYFYFHVWMWYSSPAAIECNSRFHRAMLRRAQYCHGKSSLRPSVCPSEALRYCDHICWNSLKIISWLISLASLLSADPQITDLFQREHLGVWKICSGRRPYKTGNISETVEDRAKVTINGLYKVVQELSIATKMCDLEWPLSETQSHWFFKWRKNTA